ncbi:MAG: UDP-N-acetylglucosamine--N-acetylmuramyl-(pentapeptide) pyrophosphoryl-undecaprenol N-acetylglucosamine transferase [Patescibacteria group bacterium]
MLKRVYKILLTGGGSGGHVYPLVAVAEELKNVGKANGYIVDLFYIGPRDKYLELIGRSGVEIRTIIAGKIRRYFSPENFIDVFKLILAIPSALFRVYFIMPDVIFSKGGTGALPVVIAGWFYGIPIMIHDSDAVPGLTNIASGHLAERIALSFRGATRYFKEEKTAWVGTPIRKEMLEDVPDKKTAKEFLKFDAKVPLTLVIGGSQGAEKINEFIVTNLLDILKETQLLHNTGPSNYAGVEKLSVAALSEVKDKKISGRYKAVSYIDHVEDMKTVLSAVDLVICRAGGNTITELAAFGRPAILIPLEESANGHQKENAYEFAGAGAAVVIEENNLLPSIFMSQFRSIIGNPETLREMSAAAKNFFKPGAAEVIAKELFTIAD